jgi:type I restriction-modification system DNA methylase subunit
MNTGISLDNMEVDALTTKTSLHRTEVERNELERRRSLGQFFTPHEVAQFIWDMARLFHGRKWNKSARVIDPACGEGVFLHVAVEAGHDPRRCWGVDIDESLKAYWKTDKRLRGAHVSVGNGLVDDETRQLVPGFFDLVIGNPPFGGQGLKPLLQLIPPKLTKVSRERSLFNDLAFDRADDDSTAQAPSNMDHANLDRLVRELNNYLCWRLRVDSDDPVESTGPNMNGSLFAEFDSSSQSRPSNIESMVREIADCPSNQLLDAAWPAVRNAIRRMASTAIEVFFTERFVQLAKPGGMIAVIVPESVLASDQLTPFRIWLMREIQLLAVIGLPQHVFSGIGAKAKTGILIARRYTPSEREANARVRGNSGFTRECLNAKTLLTAPQSDRISLIDYLTDVMEIATRVVITSREAARGH